MKKDNPGEIKSDLLWLTKASAVAAGVAVLLNSAVFVNAVVPTESMKGTIEPGDRFFANRLAYINKDPKRFDVIVFKFPDDEKTTFVKRIIGLPGESLNIIDGKVYIDDAAEPLDDSFALEKMNGSYGPYQIPEGCYFVLGDNRNHSNDSRFWEHPFVSRSQILGKAGLRYWPLPDFKVIE